MMNVKEIESAIAELDQEAVWELAKWFEEFQAELWDKEIEEDILAGRLDALADEALRDLDEGRVTDL
ncbi:MAG: hypothetical protein EYC68_09325 [Chloroflexota bacterium]|nr:MAG: hypothetical protein EYC68_09325 [Chloroflexota bacterium]